MAGKASYITDKAVSNITESLYESCMKGNIFPLQCWMLIDGKSTFDCVWFMEWNMSVCVDGKPLLAGVCLDHLRILSPGTAFRLNFTSVWNRSSGVLIRAPHFLKRLHLLFNIYLFISWMNRWKTESLKGDTFLLQYISHTSALCCSSVFCSRVYFILFTPRPDLKLCMTNTVLCGSLVPPSLLHNAINYLVGWKFYFISVKMLYLWHITWIKWKKLELVQVLS